MLTTRQISLVQDKLIVRKGAHPKETTFVERRCMKMKYLVM